MRYEAGDSKIEICWLAKVADAGEKHRKKTTMTNSKTEKHLEEGYSNTRQVRSEVGDSDRERDMIFHGGQPTGSKKSGMARRYKQGTSYDAYQAAVADLSVTDASNPDSEPESSDPPHVKKQRYDTNWGAVRVVRARDRKVE